MGELGKSGKGDGVSVNGSTFLVPGLWWTGQLVCPYDTRTRPVQFAECLLRWRIVILRPHCSPWADSAGSVSSTSFPLSPLYSREKSLYFDDQKL